jgi:plasmid stability protein
MEVLQTSPLATWVRRPSIAQSFNISGEGRRGDSPGGHHQCTNRLLTVARLLWLLETKPIGRRLTITINPIDMCITCNYVQHMSRMIQVRNVPDGLHRTLKARAAQAGMSLSDYLLAELRKIAERPTMEELRKRLQQMEPVELPVSAAELIRQERDSR